MLEVSRNVPTMGITYINVAKLRIYADQEMMSSD